MPAGYAATTGMESVLTGTFEFSAELSDLRVIEEPQGTSRPPSNIVKKGSFFDLYTDIHFVGTAGLPWPEVAVDVQYLFEGCGTGTETETSLVPDVYVGPTLLAGSNTHPLRVDIPVELINSLVEGIYEISAIVHVRWKDDPGKNIIMSGFIKGAPLQVTP